MHHQDCPLVSAKQYICKEMTFKFRQPPLPLSQPVYFAVIHRQRLFDDKEEENDDLTHHNEESQDGNEGPQGAPYTRLTGSTHIKQLDSYLKHIRP
jgi:hypothetical protein